MYLKFKKLSVLLWLSSFSVFSQSKDVCLFGDCQNGRGVFIDVHGNKFMGIFENGKLEGLGEVEFKNSGRFSGVYKDPSHHGKSKFVHSDTGKTEYGTRFTNGICDQNGCRTWVQFIFDSNVKCIFQGTFLQNQKTGKGSYTCNNGESFEGTYSNDLANGNGKLIYSDGTILQGEFKDGHPVRK
ncbi:MORN repeat protein [Leptospira weilii serovar Ranarum str. ICFT]|uniref:MORN repeat-containing protein 3 n=1 Tax=Leptospira weilii serovar Ranarum str. ICFT TaxID=1218598 RepID=N1WMG1_9LEPT|nr:MORN repeat protein [Leptospira weilii]EMY76963.1 MORN repeat protein [Leptospira weilii serovar Ranarum str. ICFT]